MTDEFTPVLTKIIDMIGELEVWMSKQELGDDAFETSALATYKIRKDFLIRLYTQALSALTKIQYDANLEALDSRNSALAIAKDFIQRYAGPPGCGYDLGTMQDFANRTLITINNIIKDKNEQTKQEE